MTDPRAGVRARPEKTGLIVWSANVGAHAIRSLVRARPGASANLQARIAALEARM